MSPIDLATEPDLDFAALALDYEGFRQLATNPHLSDNGRIGFADDQRRGHEAGIFEDIRAKLPALGRRGHVVLDIGPGCAGLPRLVIGLCERQDHALHLLDSPEMLAQLPDLPFIHKLPGTFPACVPGRLDPGTFDAILCYSVLHYLFIEANPFTVIDTVVQLLAPGGAALFGDIPNQSKRRRFFSTAAGEAHHRAYTGRNEAPHVQHLQPEPGRIDDSVLLGMMQRAQAAGCHAYLLPQPASLPMANRRDDLLIQKP